MIAAQALARIIAARAALVLDQPFFGVLALQLQLLIDNTCSTAWTNGRQMGFNPAFVQTLNSEQLKALVAHEVFHCAMGHPWRRDGRDAKQWNVACDYAINHVIVEAGFTLPDGALLDAQYSGHHAEWIYDRLPVPPQPDDQSADQQDQPGDAQPGDGDAQPDADDPQDGDADGAAGDGDAQDGDGDPQGELRDAPADDAGDDDAMTQEKWKETTRQAKSLSRGSLGAGVARSIDTLLKPEMDWQSPLRRFMQSLTSADYTWTRPNSRYIARGLYLPSLQSKCMGTMVIGVDTSGSIDEVLLAQFGAHLQSIAEELQPERIVVVYCDYDVCGTDEYAPGDPIVLTPHGGGGTRFSPVFDYVEAQDIQPAVLVYFTDLEGDHNFAAPDYPVLWACTTGDQPVTFGENIPLVPGCL